MMSKTHIAIGIAASLAVLQPQAASACLPVVLGGAIGGLLSDVDVRATARSRDAMQGRAIDAALSVGLLACDWVTGGQIRGYFLAHLGPQQVVGALALLGLGALGMLSAHRTFTHSLLGLALFGGALWLVCPPVVPAFAVGFISHVVLDMLNKTPVRVLFPARPGFCLGLCRADGHANDALLVVGILATGALLGVRLLALPA
ncbi:MAG: metal-dependent hydrolase [Atopobiaceae bacterium]|jgi:inner membrane protein